MHPKGTTNMPNYIVTMRKELLAITRTTGHPHPGDITSNEIEILETGLRSRKLAEIL